MTDRIVIDLDSASGRREDAERTRKQMLSDLGDTLDGIAEFLRCFVVLIEDQTTALALWVCHTWTIAATDVTPYVWITSPVKRAGKTRLLEALELLVAKPWLTGRVTGAVLYRKIEAEQPTLLLDESDAAFRGPQDYVEALRGLLNSGHRRSGTATICVPAGGDWVPRNFSTYCPKAISGIGESLPDTIADRSIRIELKRKRRDETAERFRRRDAIERANSLTTLLRLLSGADDDDSTFIDELRESRPAVPGALNDRAADSWEPLLAIAEMASDEWARKARKAAVALSGYEDEDDSPTIQLLADVCHAFDDTGAEQLTTSRLVSLLRSMADAPWGGRDFNAWRLAKMLRPFKIKPNVLGDQNLRGYRRSDFEDAFSRYLPLLKPSNRKVRKNGATTGDSGKNPVVRSDDALRSRDSAESSRDKGSYGPYGSGTEIGSVPDEPDTATVTLDESDLAEDTVPVP